MQRQRRKRWTRPVHSESLSRPGSSDQICQVGAVPEPAKVMRDGARVRELRVTVSLQMTWPWQTKLLCRPALLPPRCDCTIVDWMTSCTVTGRLRKSSQVQSPAASVA